MTNRRFQLRSGGNLGCAADGQRCNSRWKEANGRWGLEQIVLQMTSGGKKNGAQRSIDIRTADEIQADSSTAAFRTAADKYCGYLSEDIFPLRIVG